MLYQYSHVAVGHVVVALFVESLAVGIAVATATGQQAIIPRLRDGVEVGHGGLTSRDGWYVWWWMEGAVRHGGSSGIDGGMALVGCSLRSRLLLCGATLRARWCDGRGQGLDSSRWTRRGLFTMGALVQLAST